MPRRLVLAPRAAVLASLASALVLAPGLAGTTSFAPLGAAVAATNGSLSVSPSRYVPGEAVRFQGNLGVSGSQSVHLQENMNRPGDTWGDVPDSTFRTDYAGNFDFTFRAPSMINVSYRVSGGGHVTAPYVFKASPQELTLTPPGGDPNYPFYRVRPGTRYTVVVDTTPVVGGNWGTPPPFPGRTVLLQQRVDPYRWQTIGTQTTDSTGRTSFSVTAPKSGTQVLRALETNWTVGGNDIGWFPSFPAYFSTSAARAVPEPATRALPPSPAPRSSSRPTASGRFGWGKKRYDYAWEAGQALDSPPSKGTVTSGRWSASSDGTGRAVPFNGGLVLQSKFKRVGQGDRGSVAATLNGAAKRHGRWEFRLQGRLWETGARPYRFQLELIPSDRTTNACPGRSVVLADFTMGSRGMRFGVKRGRHTWSRSLPKVSLSENPFNVAVEIGRGHITWFYNGNPVGTAKASRAQLGVKLVPRLSLIGSTGAEMNGTQVNSDWQRAWSLRGGRQVDNAPAVRHGSLPGC